MATDRKARQESKMKKERINRQIDYDIKSNENIVKKKQ